MKTQKYYRHNIATEDDILFSDNDELAKKDVVIPPKLGKCFLQTLHISLLSTLHSFLPFDDLCNFQLSSKTIKSAISPSDLVFKFYKTYGPNLTCARLTYYNEAYLLDWMLQQCKNVTVECIHKCIIYALHSKSNDVIPVLLKYANITHTDTLVWPNYLYIHCLHCVSWQCFCEHIQDASIITSFLTPKSLLHSAVNASNAPMVTYLCDVYSQKYLKHVMHDIIRSFDIDMLNYVLQIIQTNIKISHYNITQLIIGVATNHDDVEPGDFLESLLEQGHINISKRVIRIAMKEFISRYIPSSDKGGYRLLKIIAKYATQRSVNKVFRKFIVDADWSNLINFMNMCDRIVYKSAHFKLLNIRNLYILEEPESKKSKKKFKAELIMVNNYNLQQRRLHS